MFGQEQRKGLEQGRLVRKQISRNKAGKSRKGRNCLWKENTCTWRQNSLRRLQIQKVYWRWEIFIIIWKFSPTLSRFRWWHSDSAGSANKRPVWHCDHCGELSRPGHLGQSLGHSQEYQDSVFSCISCHRASCWDPLSGSWWRGCGWGEVCQGLRKTIKYWNNIIL